MIPIFDLSLRPVPCQASAAATLELWFQRIYSVVSDEQLWSMVAGVGDVDGGQDSKDT